MKKRNVKKWVCYAVMLMVMIPLFCCHGKAVRAQAATVKLSVSDKTMVIGSQYQLKVKHTKSKVTWSSDNKKVATVSSSGVVTAKKAGEATITAKVGEKKLKCVVTVVVQQKSYRTKTLQLLNKERRKYGYASFDKNALLQAAAQKRAKELSQKFSHTRPNGYKWTSAISMRYDFKRAAENIARDFATPEQVVDCQ